MQRLTPYSWFAIACFTAGMLLGSIAIGYFMLTLSPVPIGATVIIVTVAASPVCMIVLLLSLKIPSLRFLMPPALLVGGLAVPLDLAFSCLLGWMNHSALQMSIFTTASVSTVALILLVATAYSDLKAALNVSQSLAITIRQGLATGASPK